VVGFLLPFWSEMFCKVEEGGNVWVLQNFNKTIMSQGVHGELVLEKTSSVESDKKD